MHQNDDQRTAPRTGLWIFGARGSVATTVAVGLAGLARGLAPATGCVTAGAAIDDTELAPFDGIVLGGADLHEIPVLHRARELAGAGMLPGALVEAVAPALESLEADLVTRPAGHASQADEIAAITAAIEAFRDRHGLERIVAIDLTSTEPLPAHRPEHDDPTALRDALAEPGRDVLPPSSRAALAAIDAGAAFAGFTPSLSASPAAIVAIARERGVPLAGQDGKTGETWLRAVVGPALGQRGFRVLSWAGANLLGGGDGATLADPTAVQSKLSSKGRGLEAFAPGATIPLHIDNVPDLGNTKVAWDHIHVEGFLGSRLTLQLTWSAYDSMLAAPMAIDLARLLDLALRAGESGPVADLGFFFKDPWGSDEHAFARQAEALRSWTERSSTLAAATRAVRA